MGPIDSPAGDPTDGRSGCSKHRQGPGPAAGDHTPRHVHVYKDGKLVVKWDLESGQPMKGRDSASMLRLIREFENEGAL